MRRDWLDILNRIHWYPTVTEIPAWTAAGIRHGFWGKGQAEPTTFHHAKQVHGVAVVEASEATSTASDVRPEADGIYTGQKDQTVAVKTADCLPILLHGGAISMALHAGWRGFQAGIIDQGLAVFASHGIPSGAITAAIGPALCRASFEIGPEVLPVLQQGTAFFGEGFFLANLMKGEGDRWHFDLPQAAALWLAARGIEPSRLHVLRSCTKLHPLVWHSYRLHGKAAGRNWSFISHE